MPIYEYKALNLAGKTIRGLVDADTAKNARLKLRKQSLSVVEINEKGAIGKESASGTSAKKGGFSLFGGGVALKDLSIMTRQLASLINAKVTVVDSLTGMVEQTENKTLKLILAQIKQDVNEGLNLSKAMAKHPKVFDQIFISMIEAAESSGTTGPVLVRIAELKEAQSRLRSKVMSGLSYPIVMLVVGLGLFIGIFTLLIPKLTTILTDFNQELPVLTKFMIMISDVMVEYWWLLIGGIVASLLIFLQWIQTKSGREIWDGFILKAPVVGNMARMAGVARFSMTMGTLLNAGVPILRAMDIVKNVMGNVILARAVINARENITEGQSISEPLKRSGQFPPVVTQMIKIGEQTGELSAMLTNIAKTYEEEVSTRIEGLTSIIAPIMIVIIGLIVALVVLAVFVPLMQMMNSV